MESRIYYRPTTERLLRKNLFKNGEALNMDCLQRPFIFVIQTKIKELRLKNQLLWNILKVALSIRCNITTIIITTIE